MSATQGFAERLTEAVLESYNTFTEAERALKQMFGVNPRTFTSHRQATRTPRAEQYEKYARFLGVNRAWLVEGVGDKRRGINQLTRRTMENASQFGAMRRISKVSAHPAKSADTRAPHMTNTDIPIPAGLGAGPRAQSWQIPSGDASMVGGKLDLQPGTWIIADPDAEIGPGDPVLCLPDGYDRFIVRIFSCDTPLRNAKRFTLLSLNPDLGYEPIQNRTLKNCQVAGRVIYAIREL